jgi:hypothetical protein
VASDIDEITVQYEEDGEVLVEELEKVILGRGLWTTIMFRYRERDRKTGDWTAPKATIRRYKKVSGYFRKQDTVNVSEKNAPTVVATLKEWFNL